MKPINNTNAQKRKDNRLELLVHKIFIITFIPNSDSLDWKDLSAAEIADRVLFKAQSGSIVLFHNAALHTPEALPEIIETLKARGFSFCPVSEMIYQEDYTINHEGRQCKVK